MLTKDYKEFLSFLEGEGHSNQINQASYDYLRDNGYTGSVPEMWYDFLYDLGYRGSLPEMAYDWVQDSFAVASFSLTLTGLSTDSIGNYGAIVSHASIGFTIVPDSGTETKKWSNSSNPADAATYGTGDSPTDFTASDGSIVYLQIPMVVIRSRPC